MIFLKQFEKIFFISLVVIITVSCSGKSKELSMALKRHKNEYGMDNILKLIKEKDLENLCFLVLLLRDCLVVDSVFCAVFIVKLMG